MNDFTKEELEGMLLNITHSSWIYKADKHTVLNKLQSMINNYCEHEKVVPNYDCKTQCEKCGVIL